MKSASQWFTNLVAPPPPSSTTTATTNSTPPPLTPEQINLNTQIEKEASLKAAEASLEAARRLQVTRERLYAFYKQWNPSKLSECNKLAKSFQGREVALWRTLKHKYVDRAQLPDGSLQRERDDGIYAFILICRRCRIPEVIARTVHAFSRNLHFWDYSGLRRPEDYFDQTSFRNRDRSLQEMVQYTTKDAFKKSLIDVGIHRHKGRVVDMGTSSDV